VAQVTQRASLLVGSDPVSGNREAVTYGVEIDRFGLIALGCKAMAGHCSVCWYRIQPVHSTTFPNF